MDGPCGDNTGRCHGKAAWDDRVGRWRCQGELPWEDPEAHWDHVETWPPPPRGEISAPAGGEVPGTDGKLPAAGGEIPWEEPEAHWDDVESWLAAAERAVSVVCAVLQTGPVLVNKPAASG